MSHEMMKPWERRLSLMAERNICNVVMRDIVVLPGPKSTQMDRVGTWDTSCLAAVCLRQRSASGRVEVPQRSKPLT